MRKVLLTLVALNLVPSVLRAQDHEGHEGSPYVTLQSRDIKALSGEDVEALLLGEGMELALAAELNGYPGPKHVLELADSLGLTSQQRQRVEAGLRRVNQRARDLGGRVVEAERALDRSFAGGAVDAANLRGAVAAIATLRGELRAVHLEAHLATTAILTEVQRDRYRTLRGYAAVPHGGSDVRSIPGGTDAHAPLHVSPVRTPD